MIDTISQKWNIFSLWIDTIGGQLDRLYRLILSVSIHWYFVDYIYAYIHTCIRTGIGVSIGIGIGIRMRKRIGIGIDICIRMSISICICICYFFWGLTDGLLSVNWWIDGHQFNKYFMIDYQYDRSKTQIF
jgi:hypothetical protein